MVSPFLWKSNWLFILQHRCWGLGGPRASSCGSRSELCPRTLYACTVYQQRSSCRSRICYVRLGRRTMTSNALHQRWGNPDPVFRMFLKDTTSVLLSFLQACFRTEFQTRGHTVHNVLRSLPLPILFLLQSRKTQHLYHYHRLVCSFQAKAPSQSCLLSQ